MRKKVFLRLLFYIVFNIIFFGSVSISVILNMFLGSNKPEPVLILFYMGGILVNLYISFEWVIKYHGKDIESED